MPLIKLTTIIQAGMETCFDLSTSIDLHTLSTEGTRERAVAGVIHGLIKKGETVTWEATHFGIRQRLTSVISAFDRPHHFRDEQVKGVFKCIIHDHYFSEKNNVTEMTDLFYFESPLGVLGKIFNRLVLTNYLRKFLIQRNSVIKDYAESGKSIEVQDDH